MLPNKINYLVRANEIKTNDQLYKICTQLFSEREWEKTIHNLQSNEQVLKIYIIL